MPYLPGYERYVMFDKFGGGEEDDSLARMRRIMRERGPGLENSGYLDESAPSQPEAPAPAPAAPAPPSAIQTAREHLATRPEPPKPGVLKRILGVAAGAGAGYLAASGHPLPEDMGQRAIENITRPGYREKLGEWSAGQQALERAAALEEKEQEDRMRQEQHRAQLGSYEASTAASKARETLYQRQMNMPSKPTAPPSNYEEHLTRILNDPNATPEDRAGAEKKLQDLHAKPERSGTDEIHHQSLAKRLLESGQAKGQDEANRMAAEIIIKAERRKGERQVSPLTGSTLQYRSDQEHARDLAGEALDISGNDKAAAKAELQRLRRERQVPYHVYQLALKEIGEPPRATGKDKGVEALRGALGIGGSTNGTSGGGSAPGIPKVGETFNGGRVTRVTKVQ